MTRLIDADELKKGIETWDKFACLPNGKLEPFINLEYPEMFDPYVHLRDIRKAIDNAPTIEYSKNSLDYDYGFAEGLKRANDRPKGKWIKINPESRGYAEFFRCSNCLSNVQISYWCLECEYDYCPTCGADMREADDE